MSAFIQMNERCSEIVENLFENEFTNPEHAVNTAMDILENPKNDLDFHVSVNILERIVDDYEFDFSDELIERIVKRVSMTDRKAGGSLVSKVKDKKTRARKATQTTGLSKSKRVKTARKAAKTRKRDKAGQRKANKKRKKSMKKRDQLGY